MRFSDIIRLTANSKDFSLTLEMTAQEFLPSPSLPVTSHQSKQLFDLCENPFLLFFFFGRSRFLDLLRGSFLGLSGLARAKGGGRGEGGHPQDRRCHDLRLHDMAGAGGGAGFAPAVGDIVVRPRGRIRDISVADVLRAVEINAAETFEQHGGHDLRGEVGEGQRWRHAGDGGEEGAFHIVHRHVQTFPDLIHEQDHALLRREKVLVGHEVVLIAHTGHIHEEDEVKVGQCVVIVLDADVEIRHGIVHVAQLRPFPCHGVEGDLLLKSAVKDAAGGVGLAAGGESGLRLTDLALGQTVVLTDVQYVGHVVSDLRLPFLGKDVDLRDAMSIVLLRHFGDDTAHELSMCAFTGEIVSFEEIGERFVRQHGERLLRTAHADPAVIKELSDAVIRITPVDALFIGWHLVVRRLAIEVVQEQDVFDR